MKNSTIFKKKSKFFINRLVSYFAFLLIPVWIPKFLQLNYGLQLILMSVYTIFMIMQWFLLGKEIDHRLKIYYRVNSSIDRVIYRAVMGMIVMVVYFNLLNLLPPDILKHFFWGTWVGLGLFYSWPTRGKIIQESVSDQFSEFKFLDSFEKTVLFLIIFIFIISVPAFPSLTSIDALKLYFDPYEKFSSSIWIFLKINYFPFKKFPHIFHLCWNLHFYLIGMGIYLLTFYALLRFFLVRRLAILGIFALISSWTFAKILGANLAVSMTTTFSCLWIWSLLWVAKSSTYRSGLFLGLLGYWGTILNQSYFFLMVCQIFLLYSVFLKDKTFWYRRQTCKYALFGLCLALMTLLLNIESLNNFHALDLSTLFHSIVKIVERKAFFSLSILGLIVLIVKFIDKKRKIFPSNFLGQEKTNEFLMGMFVIFLAAFIIDAGLLQFFGLMWIITFLALLPLEWIFQSISRMRSKRNLFYGIYIIICLLDSHIEGRIKILSKFFFH